MAVELRPTLPSYATYIAVSDTAGRIDAADEGSGGSVQSTSALYKVDGISTMAPDSTELGAMC